MFIYHLVQPLGSIPLAGFTKHPDKPGSENPHAPAEVAIEGINDVEGYGSGSEPCSNDIELHVASVVRHDGHGGESRHKIMQARNCTRIHWCVNQSRNQHAARDRTAVVSPRKGCVRDAAARGG